MKNLNIPIEPIVNFTRRVLQKQVKSSTLKNELDQERREAFLLLEDGTRDAVLEFEY